MLVEMGGDMEGTDEFGRTRLVHAVISGHEKTVKVFVYFSPLSNFSSGYHILYLSFPIFLSHLKSILYIFSSSIFQNLKGFFSLFIY
jgi:hypothetical protein